MNLKSKLFLKDKDRRIKMYITKTYSTYRITLTDLRNRVVLVLTSRTCGISGNRRRRKSPLAMETMIRNVISKLKDYGFKKVEVVLTFRFNRAIRYMFRELRTASIIV